MDVYARGWRPIRKYAHRFRASVESLMVGTDGHEWHCERQYCRLWKPTHLLHGCHYLARLADSSGESS